MKVLVAATAGAGHVNPLRPWMAALRRAGHELLAVGPPGLGALLPDVDLRTGAAPDPEVLGPLWQRVFRGPAEERERLVHGEIFTRVNAGALRPGMDAIFEQFRPDLVLRDPIEWASAEAAVRHDVPQVRVAISLATQDESFVSHAEPIVEEWLPGTLAAVRAAPYVTRFPASLDPARNADTRRYRLALPPARRPDSGFVYATLGTEAGKFSQLRDWYDLLAASLEGHDALLTVGRAIDPASVRAPAGVVVEQWTDHDDVLARAAVVVHHGGSGTTLDALAAGCPQVVVPLFADQPANAAAVAASGVGFAVDRGSGFDMRLPYDGAPADLRRAVEEALGAPAVAAHARAVAAEMAGLPELEVGMLA